MSRKITILEQSFNNLLLPLNSDENKRRFASALGNIFKTLNEFYDYIAKNGKNNSYIELIGEIKNRTVNNLARNILSPDDFAVLQAVFNEIVGAYGRNLDNDEMSMTNAYIQEITQEMLQSIRPGMWPSQGPSIPIPEMIPRPTQPTWQIPSTSPIIQIPGIMPRPGMWPSQGPSIPTPEMVQSPRPAMWPSQGPSIPTPEMVQSPRPGMWPSQGPSIPTPEMMQSPRPATWQRASKDDPSMAPGQPMPPPKYTSIRFGKSKRRDQQEETKIIEKKNNFIGTLTSKIKSVIQRFLKKEEDDYAVYFPPLCRPDLLPEVVKNPRSYSQNDREDFRRTLIIPFYQLGIKNPSLIKNCTFHTINGTTYYKTERGMVEVHGTDFEKY